MTDPARELVQRFKILAATFDVAVSFFSSLDLNIVEALPENALRWSLFVSVDPLSSITDLRLRPVVAGVTGGWFELSDMQPLKYDDYPGLITKPWTIEGSGFESNDICVIEVLIRN